VRKRASIVAGATGVLIAAAIIRKRRKYDLFGKNVFIAGGSRGLGLLLAEEFSRRGARVAICARDSDELERARIALQRKGHDVFTILCDLSVEDEVARAIKSTRESLGSLDVLVNNAGTISVGPMEVMNLHDYQESLDTHFWGPLYATLAVLPDMRRRGEGRIVNISSIGGKIAVPHLLPYCAGKFALTGFSEGLRAEAIKDHIYVTTVCPGLMRTGSPRNAKFKGQHRAEYAWFSISDALPPFSMSARRAARKIVRACVQGKAEVILSLPAKLAAKLYALFPGISADLLGLVNRVLPPAGDADSEAHLGSESFSALSPSPITVLNERAAGRNNEVA